MNNYYCEDCGTCEDLHKTSTELNKISEQSYHLVPKYLCTKCKDEREENNGNE